MKSNLKTVAKKIKKNKPAVPSSDDPKAELRNLVNVHRALVKASVALHNMATDKELEDGTIVKCLLPEDDKADLLEDSKKRKATAKSMEGVKWNVDGSTRSGMTAELRKFEVYNLFLSKVFGAGPVVSAYLCAMVDIHRAVKPSQLVRYAGYACTSEGKAERRAAGCGPKHLADGTFDREARGTYNADLKTRLWQLMGAMWKNAAKSGGSTKYIDRWTNEKKRRLLRGEKKGKAHDAGRRAATELLLYDLYLVWRALEGLDSWTTYYDWARGYEHGRGPLPRENAPRRLSVEQALELVGNVGLKKTPMPIAAE